MKSFLPPPCSAGRRNFEAAAGVFLFAALPLLLFHPEEKKYDPPAVKGKQIIFLNAPPRAGSKLDYMLTYHDPRGFLFPGEMRGFGLFRTMQEESLFNPLPRELPDILRDLPRPEPGMKPVPLPAADPAFQMPVMPVPSGLPKADAAVPPQVFPGPAIRMPDGSVLPGSRMTDFKESAIRKLNPSGPTRLILRRPLLPDIPFHAEILRSCGAPQLDQEAVRTMNRLLSDSDLAKSLKADVYSVYWLPPASAPGGEGGPES